MPLRPQLPAGLNLSRRVTTPVKLPKMSFPMGEGYADQSGEASMPAAVPGPAMAAPGPGIAGTREASMARLAIFQQPDQAYEQPAPAQAAAPAYERPAPTQEDPSAYEQPAPARAARAQAAPEPAYAKAAPAMATVPAAQAHQIIIYGRAGCQASIAAIQDLIDREVSFTYYDVGRDAGAMAHLQAICGNAPMVPVIIQIGFDGA